jgi:hypothetical protein
MDLSGFLFKPSLAMSGEIPSTSKTTSHHRKLDLVMQGQQLYYCSRVVMPSQAILFPGRKLGWSL